MKSIDRALGGDSTGGFLSRAVYHASRGMDKATLARARSVFRFLEEKHGAYCGTPEVARGVTFLCKYHEKWTNDPEAFLISPPQGVWVREFAAFLLARFPVPLWLMNAWDVAEPRLQEWYVIVAQGGNLASAKNLPFPLSKLSVHHAMAAPRGLDAIAALRWGQFRALRVPEELCDETAHSRLAQVQQDEAFWRSFGEWLAANPEVIGHVNTLVEYLHAQRFGEFGPAPQPNFTITGRSPDRVLHLALNYQHQVEGLNKDVPLRWKACGIPGYTQQLVPGDAREVITILELTTGQALRLEGESLNHCVLSYARQAANGDTAIYSLRYDADGELKRLATIEVWPRQKKVVQVRGQSNRLPSAEDRAVIERWAEQVGLEVAPMAMDFD